MFRSFIALSFAGLLAACGQPAPPSSPPEATTPPPLATSGFLTAYVEEDFPMTVPELRDFLATENLIDQFEPVGKISTPVATEILSGTWPEPDAVRRVELADGHYVIERITANEPDFFQYQIFLFTNATGRGVEQIVGEQRFVPTDDGTRFEWTYNVLPHNTFVGLFVRSQMDDIETYISNGLSRYAQLARARVNGS
ncbi:SRPBCC family protein [Sulfitobacter sp. S190]|uniref:SRPBCC family protein n=1 Tax=Sulfitobacter sp. S190 TaxID=2867022 RepID=UPI0021A96EA1|nr:SRPBCC family protein [Sulfitobacter sp. S190]UWR22051.1 SRPBCC family protein [Sulfitobacter sp. S190]